MRTGLTSSQVTKNREKYGSNQLPEKKLKTGFQFFMETFEDRLNQILLAMMIVFTVLAVFGQGSYSEPIGVAVVLLAIAFIGMNTGYEADSRMQNFGMVSNAYIRMSNEETGEEMIRYDLGEDYSTETSMVLGELYRHNGEWKFNAIGAGYAGGLTALCNGYGL